MNLALSLLWLCSALPLAAQNKAGADVLGQWVGGQWPLEGKMLDTEFSKAATLKGVSKCAWSPDQIFVVCDEIVYANGKPERNLGVYSFDPKNATYHYAELTPSGKRPQVSELIISGDGKRWEYRESAEIRGQKLLFHTINEHRGTDMIEWWNEYSRDDGQHWTRTGGGTEKREPSTSSTSEKSQADVLARWVGGKWVGDARFLDTEYSKASAGGGITKCDWSPDHVFVICDQDMQDNGTAMRSLSVYSFDPENNTYHFVGLSPEGDRPRTGDVNITENGGHCEHLTKTTIKDKPVWFRTINQFKTDNQVDWWSEYSTDEGQHWTKTGGGSEKREK